MSCKMLLEDNVLTLQKMSHPLAIYASLCTIVMLELCVCVPHTGVSGCVFVRQRESMTYENLYNI